MEEYNFSSNVVKDQATLFKCAKISHGYINQHQNKLFPNNPITNEYLNKLHSSLHFHSLTLCSLHWQSEICRIGSIGFFDIVDHFFLLSRLSARFGICDHATNWLRSYLSDRTQFVRIQDVSSLVNNLRYGVPRGSVLGPLLYSLYTSQLGDIARSYGLCYHFYADDTQLYLSFET